MISPGHLVSVMPQAGRWRARRLDWPVLLAVALPVLAFIVEGDISLSLLDEGFLWYGAQRVLVGEVPLRDFQSYDIGRYYWSAAWMLLTGSTGILPVRAGSAVLGVGAAVIATLLVRSGPNRSPLHAGLAALTFSLLMVPSEKVVDNFAAVLLTGGLARLLHRPVGRRWAEFGACLGLASTIGINHALYGVIGVLLAAAYLAGVRRQRLGFAVCGPLALGAAIGYAPVLLFQLLVPGFAAAFVDAIRQLFEVRATNLALPMPSLGRLTDIAGSAEARRESALAVLFVAALCFAAVCAARLLRRERGQLGAAAAPAGSGANAAFAAGAIMAVPYAHYAVSRADFVHVVVSVLPLLIAAWTYPGKRRSVAVRLALPALALACCGYLLTKHPGFLWLSGVPLERTQVHGETLRLPPQTAAEMHLLYRQTAEYAAGGQAIYVAPYWPGAYAATGRRSPGWEIYALFPSLEWRQRREIARLAAADIALALVLGWQMDQRADLGFERTHPLIAAYVRRCFDERDIAANPIPRLRAYVANRDRCKAN